MTELETPEAPRITIPRKRVRAVSVGVAIAMVVASLGVGFAVGRVSSELTRGTGSSQFSGTGFRFPGGGIGGGTGQGGPGGSTGPGGQSGQAPAPGAGN
jgi:hypothetical protein